MKSQKLQYKFLFNENFILPLKFEDDQNPVFNSDKKFKFPLRRETIKRFNKRFLVINVKVGLYEV